MSSAAAASAHVCTGLPPRTEITLDLRVFADTMPTTPPSDAEDATFWAQCARNDMVELQAACALTAQLRAGGRLPMSLGLTLTNLERMLRQKIRASINDHDRSGGADTALLLVELNAISVVTAPRGAA